MLGFNLIRTATLQAVEKKVADLETEVKGYYENQDAGNKYFAAIAPLLRGADMGDIRAAITRDKLKEAYENNGPAYGIINRIAKAVGEMFPFLELQKWSGKTWEDVDNHPIIELLHHPNDRFNCQRFGTAWAINKLVYGDATTYAPSVKAGKDRGAVKEMYIIPGHRIDIEKGGYKQPFKGIKVKGGATPELIEPKDFFMSFDYNLDDTSFFGTSPLVVAAVYLSVIDRGMDRQNISLLNGGPTAIVSPKADNLGVLPQTADKLTEDLNGKEVKGQIKAVRAPIDIHTLGVSPIDLGILNSHKEAITALCFIYGVPVDLYYGQSKYENAKEAKKSLYESTAIPMANEFGRDLLAHLGMDKDFRLTVNTDRVDVLQDSPKDVLANLTLMGATLNEKREAYGYERIEEDWADKPMIPMSTVFGGDAFNDLDEV